MGYTLNLWPKLQRCLEYGEVELSNNLAENSMRPVTLGRKNWLHVGSAQAGPKVAAIFSVIESCRRLGVPTAGLPARCLARYEPQDQVRIHPTHARTLAQHPPLRRIGHTLTKMSTSRIPGDRISTAKLAQIQPN